MDISDRRGKSAGLSSANGCQASIKTLRMGRTTGDREASRDVCPIVGSLKLYKGGNDPESSFDDRRFPEGAGRGDGGDEAFYANAPLREFVK